MSSSNRSGSLPVQKVALSTAWRLFVAACSVVWLAAVAGAQSPPTSARGWLDPITGRVTTQKPAGVDALELSASELEMLSTSDEGLTIRRSAGRALSVDLQGRFRHMSVATIGPDGKLHGSCVGTASTPSIGPVGEAEQAHEHDTHAVGADQ